VRHDAVGRRNENVTKLTRRQQIDNPFFNFTVFNIKARRNYSTLVEPPIQLDDNLIRSVIINDLKLSNVTYSHIQTIVSNWY
jgi:hypothetical protein